MNSIKLQNRMVTIFMNSKNSVPCDTHKLLLNFTDKVDLTRSDKYPALSSLIMAFTIHGKI